MAWVRALFFRWVVSERQLSRLLGAVLGIVGGGGVLVSGGSPSLIGLLDSVATQDAIAALLLAAGVGNLAALIISWHADDRSLSWQRVADSAEILSAAVIGIVMLLAAVALAQRSAIRPPLRSDLPSWRVALTASIPITAELVISASAWLRVIGISRFEVVPTPTTADQGAARRAVVITDSWISPVVVAIIPLILAALVRGPIRRAFRGERVQVEATADQGRAVADRTRAQTDMDAIRLRLDQQAEFITALDARTQRAEARAEAADSRADAAERQVDGMRQLLRRHQDRIDQLAQVLRERNITVPPPRRGDPPEADEARTD